MKKILLAAITICFFTTGTNAQVQRKVSPSQSVQSDSSRHFGPKKMINELDLTANQKEQVRALHENAVKQKNEIMNDPNLTADQRKEKLKALHQYQKKTMNEVLTPEQRAKRKTLMAERKQNHPMNGKMMHKKRNADSTNVQ